MFLTLRYYIGYYIGYYKTFLRHILDIFNIIWINSSYNPIRNQNY
jgi:hypothetical protein